MQKNYKRVGDYIYKSSCEPLGKGSSGTVYSADNKAHEGHKVAIKVISIEKINQSEAYYKKYITEVKALQKIRNENIVQVLGVKNSKKNVYIITELCNGGDLYSHLKQNGPLEEQRALEIIYQISKAFNIMGTKSSSNSQLNDTHKNIETFNILFHNNKIKLANFGLVKKVNQKFFGTPSYTAPQIFKGEDYTPKCDVWSSGVVLYECLFGQLPWTGTSIANLYIDIHTKPLEFPKSITRETRDLIEKMLERNANKRISWEEIQAHPAMKTIGNSYDPANITLPLFTDNSEDQYIRSSQ